MEDHLFLLQEDELPGEDWLDPFATEILDAKNNVLDVDKFVNDMNHLADSKKDDTRNFLNKYLVLQIHLETLKQNFIILLNLEY